ncbi:NF038122 family metalloprotease [Pseudoduganella violaceinigra]|uniref:NF038122 family metalloprotease n=1 Tax=Pseudoduganella violaceinigra TaxID=246602 RepID=UPI0003FAFD84|nr:NF038122 family metalloprotease [Pseudoduganella violaceinigra]
MKTLLAGLLLAAGTASAAPVFHFNYLAGTSIQAQQGFQAAAARWSSLLNDNVTINLTVGFNSLGGGILGQAASAEDFHTYASVRNALAADATSAADATAVAHLPGGSSFGMLINRTANNPYGAGSPIPYIDHNGDANNQLLYIANAEAKALGLAVTPQTLQGCIGNCDGFIQFNSDFNFDFNPNNGTDANAFDFVGVASHEIGHVLGFISGVDILDYNSPPVNGPFEDNEFTYASTLDLFRYSAASAAQGVIDWTADARSKYFSLDGATVGPQFSTGENFGDGRQASHWKDDLFIGLMDPTAGMGETLHISGNDVLAMDAIGWNVAAIPEPSGWAMLGAGLLLLVARQRGRSGKLS